MCPISLSQLINGQERAYPCLSHTFQNTSHCPMGKGVRKFCDGVAPKIMRWGPPGNRKLGGPRATPIPIPMLAVRI